MNFSCTSSGSISSGFVEELIPRTDLALEMKYLCSSDERIYASKSTLTKSMLGLYLAIFHLSFAAIFSVFVQIKNYLFE